MAFEPGDGGTYNPYQDQTNVNTSLGWLADDKVEIDLERMGDYAQGLRDLQGYLFDHALSVQQLLATLPMQAWSGWPQMPEAVLLADSIRNSTEEFGAYLQQLNEGLFNIGMAAQSIADIYAGTDGWSAATVGAVEWVLGTFGASRPANAPDWIKDQTYSQALASGQRGAPPEGSGLWTVVDQSAYYGAVITRSVGPGGMTMVVATYRDATGAAIRTTTIYDADGKQLTTRVQTTVTVVDGDTTTTRVTTTQDGKSAGGTETRETTAGGQVNSSTTTNLGGDGKPTQVTELVTQPDGTQTISTYDIDEHGNRVEPPVRVIAVGAQTGGPNANEPDPGEVAQDELGVEDNHGLPRVG